MIVPGRAAVRSGRHAASLLVGVAAGIAVPPVAILLELVVLEILLLYGGPLIAGRLSEGTGLAPYVHRLLYGFTFLALLPGLGAAVYAATKRSRPVFARAFLVTYVIISAVLLLGAVWTRQSSPGIP